MKCIVYVSAPPRCTSLHKLQTEYLDLLLIHWPMGNNLAIYHEMEQLVRRGRVRTLGLSNFYGRVYDEIIAHYEICPSVIQQETHLFMQNRELQNIYQRQGVALEAWAPFGEGRENMLRLPLVKELSTPQHPQRTFRDGCRTVDDRYVRRMRERRCIGRTHPCLCGFRIGKNERTCNGIWRCTEGSTDGKASNNDV